MNLAESELILNADGSIYHLALQPEQVAPLIITVGDPERVRQVSRYFDVVEHRVRRREFATHTGRLGDKRITVISTGIGPDNVDIVLNELDALVNIDFRSRLPKPRPTALTLIRLGTAGTPQPEIPVDSMVCAAGAFGLDGVLQFYQAPALQQHEVLDALRQHGAAHGWAFPVAPYFAAADPGLLSGFIDFQVPVFRQVGFTATNSGFYAPQGRQLRAAARLPGYLSMLQQFGFQGKKILNLEMETAAIYGFAHLLGHRALSISAILANRATGQFSRQPGRTVRKLLELVLEKLSSGV